MATGRDLIKSTFRLIGVYANSEEPTADEINDALYSLNTLKDSLNLENQVSYQTLNSTYTFIPNQVEYLWGPTGDFFISQSPVAVSKITIHDFSNNIDLQCRLLTTSDWADIILKSIASPLPMYATLNVQSDGSTKIKFWPVPNGGNYGCTIYYLSFMVNFDLNSDIILPPGFERMLRYNLAIEIAPEYGVTISVEVAAVAAESLANVMRQNSISQPIGVDRAILDNNSYWTYANILAGQ